MPACCALTWLRARRVKWCERVARARRLVYSEGASVPAAASRLPGTRSTWENPHQADVPTQEELPAEDAWFSRADGNPRRTSGPQGAPAQGPEAIDACEHRVKRRHRLRGRGRFAAIRSAGVESRSGAVRARALPSDRESCRVGLAVPGARTAVERNRTRRLLRAAVDPLVGALPSVDVVVTAPARAAIAGLPALSADVARAVRAAARLAGDQA